MVFGASPDAATERDAERTIDRESSRLVRAAFPAIGNANTDDAGRRNSDRTVRVEDAGTTLAPEAKEPLRTEVKNASRIIEDWRGQIFYDTDGKKTIIPSPFFYPHPIGPDFVYQSRTSVNVSGIALLRKLLDGEPFWLEVENTRIMITGILHLNAWLEHARFDDPFHTWASPVRGALIKAGMEDLILDEWSDQVFDNPEARELLKTFREDWSCRIC